MSISIRPTAINAFFWEGAREDYLLVQRCADCGQHQHPPLPCCAHCGSELVVPAPVTGRGVIDSFTIVRRAFHPAFADRLPYLVARIRLDEADDLFVVSNVVGCQPDDVTVGDRVRVCFEHREDGSLPQFTPEHNA